MTKEAAYRVLGLEPNADFYQILGVSSNAPNNEIRKSYKKLALKYHPDKYKENDEVFKLIGEAGTTLGDDQKRDIYDSTLDNKKDAKPQTTEISLEELLKQAEKFSREQVEEYYLELNKRQGKARISMSELDEAIKEGNEPVVISEVSARIMDCINENKEQPDNSKRRIEDMLSYVPEYRDEVEQVIIKKISGEIVTKIEQGSGYFFDDQKKWQEVENLLDSVPNRYHAEIVGKSLEKIDNSSRRDRLVDLLPENERAIATMGVEPTVWQKIRIAADALSGGPGDVRSHYSQSIPNLKAKPNNIQR